MAPPGEPGRTRKVEPPPGWVRELAPYPAGPMPTNDPPGTPAQWRWTKRRWEVYCTLHHGHTTRETAKICGYSKFTVEALRYTWNKRYGLSINTKAPEEALNNPLYLKPMVHVEEASEQVVIDHHVAGEQARQVVQRFLAQFVDETAESKARLAKLTPAEVKAIQEIGLNAERAAKGDLAPAKGRAAAKEPPARTSAQKAVQGLSAPVVRKGRKGEAAEAAGSTAQGLRSQLLAFRQAMSPADDQEAAS